MRTIAILAVPGVQLLDVAGPLDVFAEANRQGGRELYRLLVVGVRNGPIPTSSGVALQPHCTISSMLPGKLDTLLVAGSPELPDGVLPQHVTAWIARIAGSTRRFGSVCSGAFLLAAAGLLKGKRITTHWAVVDKLVRDFPDILVDQDAIHVRDGGLRTAAGVTAGLDLALSFVEEDFGSDIAVKVASHLVMFFKRPGGQMQFSRKGESMPAGRSALQEAQRWIAANPAVDLSIPRLAKRTGLSPRHFTRLFRSEVGVTPAAFVEAARISAARRLLEAGANAPKQVAVQCGFSDVDTLRRAFMRHVGITPAEYRKRFVAAAAAV